METFEEKFREILGRLSYRDWTFHLGKDAIGLYYLQLRWPDFDVRTDEITAHSGRKWRLSQHMTRSEVVQTALAAVLAAEEHEARERFLYLGRRIFWPTMNVDALWVLIGEDDAEEKRDDPR